MLARNLFLAGQNGFGAAKVDNPAAFVAALHDAGNNFAHAVLVFGVDDFLFRVAHALNDDLLGGLGGNAAQIFHLDAEAHFVVHLHGRIVGARLGKFYLRVGVGHVVIGHDDFELVDLNVAGFVIIGHLHVHVFAEAAQHRGAHGVFKRVDEHVAVKAFVLADLVDGLFEFKIHGCLRLLRAAA